MKLTRDPNGQPLEMPWKKCIGMGRAYELLRTDVMEHLAWLQEQIGFEACRFHALFHDDMDVMRLDAQGKPYYQWHQIDKVYDNLLSVGLRPFVELNPMPSCLASGPQTMFFYKMNVTPPKDWDLWEDLVFQFTRHVTERYGQDEVANWHFEVWNEPNLTGFWGGTQEQYFELYRRAAKAVKRVSPHYMVGGPASSKASWITEFIDFCDKNDVPVDFVSTHLYGQDEYVEYPKREGSPFEIGAYFTQTVKEAREKILRSPKPDLELHWTEWNTMQASAQRGVTWGKNPDVDTQFAAAHVAKHCLELDKTVESFSYWTATDIFEEGGIPDAAFSCTYGMLTIHGIPKASANAFRLLDKLRGPQLAVAHDAGKPKYADLVATVDDAGLVHVLAHYYKPHEIPESQLPTWQGELDVSALLGEGEHKAIEARIVSGHGSCWEAWQAMGAPLNLTRQEEEFLRAAAMPLHRLHRGFGGSLKFSLQPGEVAYFEFSPITYGAAGAKQRDGDFALWDKLMGEKSQ